MIGKYLWINLDAFKIYSKYHLECDGPWELKIGISSKNCIQIINVTDSRDKIEKNKHNVLVSLLITEMY